MAPLSLGEKSVKLISDFYAEADVEMFEDDDYILRIVDLVESHVMEIYSQKDFIRKFD